MRRIHPPASEAVTSLALLALVLLYLLTVLPNLENDPILGGDEGWIMSASARLAEDGVFGSELFAGFYGAEDHYFFNLPLHHVVLAGVFEVAGAGIVAARLVSVAAGLAALLLTYALGRRVGGPWLGLSAAALLTLLRLNLTPFSGLTLTDLGATVRYDLIATPYGVAAAILVLGADHSRSRGVAVALAGLLIGLAALTQFIGAFFFAPVSLFLLSEPALATARRLLLTGLLGLAMLLSFLPYGVYMLDHWDDFRGQARAVEQQTDFLSPSFYWRQLKREPDRYAIGAGLIETPGSLSDLVSRPSARLAILVLAPLALVQAVVQAHRGSAPHRLLALLIFGLVAQLALFESTKRFVYAVVLVPFVCIAIADLGRAAWRARPFTPRLRLAPRLAVAAVIALVAVEGLVVAAKDLRDSPDAPGYAALTTSLQQVLPADATVLGDNRLWPALRGQPYRSLLLLFYHTNPAISRDRTTDIFGAMSRIDADYLVLSPLSREILARLSTRDAADFERYLSERAEPSATLPYPGYGPLEVYRLRH